MEIEITDNTMIQTQNISLSVAEIRALEPICISGLTAELIESPAVMDALNTLVCLAVNPLRPIMIN